MAAESSGSFWACAWRSNLRYLTASQAVQYDSLNLAFDVRAAGSTKGDLAVFDPRAEFAPFELQLAGFTGP